ncbi:microsomal signal peptidase subunit SPC12 [Ascobolus immersus RN42]|uniref:Signal peptidase complex subunit 1 n=1 Tax=Ascobolus immersus RN42 TaxID=1160509 RepID=A0A3N4I9Z5_ASCIM|nr:microsomal signal peptidase subunit SPC12 [Ascobolus immersus RN42]
MEAIMERVYTIVDGFIDFEGQKMVEQISTYGLIAFGFLSFLVGFVFQDLVYTLYVMGAGTVLTILVTVPPWPVFNKNPQRFHVEEKEE